VWSLSLDAKTLTIDAALETPRGEQRMKAVFHKQ